MRLVLEYAVPWLGRTAHVPAMQRYSEALSAGIAGSKPCFTSRAGGKDLPRELLQHESCSLFAVEAARALLVHTYDCLHLRIGSLLCSIEDGEWATCRD